MIETMAAENPKPNNHEESLSFADIMLRQERRLSPQLHAKSGSKKQTAADRLRTAGHQEKKADADGRQPLGDDYCYKDRGCQNRRFQRLKRGKIKIAASCDLHGCTAEQAKQQLSSFLNQLMLHSTECALVICGKGLHSPSHRPIVKNIAAALMRLHTKVLAYCPALQKDGGHGAFYVLIRH